MRELIEYIVTALVDYPEAFSLEEERSEGHVLFRLRLDPRDTGKIIGRQGQVIQALRSVVRVAATREGLRASIEVQRPGSRSAQTETPTPF